MKAVIVEDEARGLENIQIKLKQFCPHVAVVGTARSVEDAVKEIRATLPDLVFLDIHLGPANGFGVIEQLPHLDFKVIITTDHQEYGIEAVKANVVDYLLKPIDPEELSQAVDKAFKLMASSPDQNGRIAIPVADGRRVISMNEILYVRANNKYSSIHLFSEKTIDCTKVLSEVEKSLMGHDFYRIHRSHLVNMEYVEQFSNHGGKHVVMSDGAQLNISDKFEEAFMARIRSSF